MNRFYYLFILVFFMASSAIAQPVITGVLVPQIMADTTKGTGEGPRTPYIYRAKITGLTANATYRYRSQAICLSYYNGPNFASDGPTSGGAGNEIFVRQSGSFGYSTLASLSTAGAYDSLTANSSGEYEGWFGVEPTGNQRFNAGNYIHPRLVLNNGVTGNTTSAYYLTVNDSAKTTTYGTGATQGTGVWSKSMASDRNFAVLWDNVAGTGRPLSIAIIENDGIAYRNATTPASPTNYPLFYRTNVDTFSGAWGTIMPNGNANGVRRIENRKLTDGTVVYANLDADGIWPTGAASTVSPNGGYTAIKLDSSDVPLVPMPTFFFEQTTYSVNENGTSVTIGVKYKNPAFTPSSVDVFVKSGGSAITGTDFTLSTTTLTFSVTDTMKTITIPVTNDALIEGNETFILGLNNPTNSALLRADSNTTITILDDDIASPLFLFNQVAYSVNENGTNVIVAVKYKNQSGASTTVDVSIKTGGTATGGGTDYTFTNTTLTFALTDTMKTITIPVNNDALVEGNETFLLRLSNPSGTAVLTVDSVTTITILDDDFAAPTVSFLSSKQNVGEATATAVITVKLSIPATTASTVNITGSNATATSGDYSFTNTTLNFAIGDSIKTVTASITDDALVEGNEYFIVQISSSVGVVAGAITSDTVTIVDNDYPRLTIGQISTVNPVTGVADSLNKKYDIVGVVYGINYRPAGLQFVIRDNTGGITGFKSTGNYGYTVKEGDSVRIPGTVAQFNGLTELNADTVIVLGTNKSIKTPVVVTKLVEANENDLVRLNGMQFVTPISTWPTAATNISLRNATDTIVLRLQLANTDILGKPAPVGSFDVIGLGSQFDASNPYTSGYQLFPRFFSDIISSTPPATVTIDTAAISVNENIGTVRIKLKISNVNGFATSVNLVNTGTATVVTDYTAPASVATFPTTAVNGDSIMVTYTIIDDAAIESNETIIAGFTAGSNATLIGSTKTITIIDNDAPATIQIDTTSIVVNENAGDVKVKVKISNVNGKVTTATLTFTGTAIGGTDYTAPATTITFPATAVNGDSIMVTYNITNDVLYEPTQETIITTYTTGTNCAISGGNVQTTRIADNDPNGINSKSQISTIVVYPNPSNGSVTIKSENEILSLKVIDVLGKEVVILQPASSLVTVQNLAKGIYIVVAQTKDGIATERLIVN